jgi:hypothetical protein
MVYSGDLPVVPGNRNRVPTCFGDRAAVSSIASPIHAGALLKGFGFPSMVIGGALVVTDLGRSSGVFT